MKPEYFIKTAKDPLAWRSKALSLRRSADVLWDEFSRQMLASIDKETKKTDDQKMSDAGDILRNSQFLYSLSAECALKGLIIQNSPEDVVFETSMDGNDNLLDAKIKQIGKIKVDTHNVEKLAEVAGVLNKGESPQLREVLAFSFFCISWIGRYPVPLDTSSDFKRRMQVPTVVFNHYYRDLMDPFLDEVIEKINC